MSLSRKVCGTLVSKVHCLFSLLLWIRIFRCGSVGYGLLYLLLPTVWCYSGCICVTVQETDTITAEF